ncbi:kinase-like domain-containing protein [Coniochaeta sp. 2T2.1]|nr:kinase-like domain-containing protein [Coniochaeta sp. 2T2.1]
MSPNAPIVTITKVRADVPADNLIPDLLGLRAPSPEALGLHGKDLDVDELERDLQDEAGQSHREQRNDHPDQQANDLLTATAPIRGRGVPPIQRTPLGQLGQQATSVVTDLGYQLHSRRRTNSNELSHEYDSSSGDLQGALHRAMVYSGVCRRPFLPCRRLPELVNKVSVAAELKRFQSITERIQTHFSPSDSYEELANLARQICGLTKQSWRAYPEPVYGNVARRPPSQEKTYRKILTILLLIERPSRIRHFIEAEVCDADLPLQRVETNNFFKSKPWTLGRKSSPNVPLPCFSTWRHATVKAFEATQWTVIAPFLGQDERKLALRFRIPESAVLPFTKWERVHQRGGSGEVFRAEIHPAHHDFDDFLTPQASKKHVFAVKRLFAQDEAKFRHEFDVLRTISKNPHPHLITLLVAYEQHGSYHLVFPWAKANLLGYWQNHNGHPNNDAATACWLAEQCAGLASGFATINKYPTLSSDSMFNRLVPCKSNTKRNSKMLLRRASHCSGPRQLHCRHGDIKPENILWFPGHHSDGTPSIGTLKITDFGNAELNTSAVVPWRHAPTSPMYRPPEADLPLSDSVIRYLSYDIWGLGCVYLEFAAWCFGGWQGIEAFLNRRWALDNRYLKFHTGTFFDVHNDNEGTPMARVKQGVHEYVNEMRQDSKCTHFFHDFLNLVCEQMLIVEHEGSGRMGAASISAQISEMVSRGKQGAKYFSEPCSCCRSGEEAP